MPKGGASIDFNLSPGMHQAICVAMCVKEQVPVEFNGEKKVQDQIQLYFAAKDGDVVKTILTKCYNFTFNEKATLAKDLKNWGVTFEAIGDLVGKRASLVCVKNGKFTNINSILPAQGDTKIDLENVYLPKFWFEVDGVQTGYPVKSLDEVGVRPEKESEEA